MQQTSQRHSMSQLDMQLQQHPLQCLLYSRTQLDKLLLLLNLQKGNNSLQVLCMEQSRRQRWVNWLDWFDLLDRQLWPYPLYSRTQLDKVLLLNFQKGNTSLQVLYMHHNSWQSWVNLLDWFDLLDTQQPRPRHPPPLYSRTQQGS